MSEFWKYAILLAGKIKEKTVSELLTVDKTYNDKWPQLLAAESSFMDLDLTEQQREVINNMLECREDLDNVYSDLSYIAGYIDCIDMLRKADLIEL